MKIGVFADVGNLFYCINKRFPGRKLDYRKYLEKAINGNDLYRAFAYGGQIGDHATDFILCLRDIGYEPKFKEPKQYEVGTKREIGKADWDVGISIDVVTLLNMIDIVIIGSSDPDLVPLVNYVRAKGVPCHIFACGIARDLKNSANSYCEIDESLLVEETEAEPESS